MKSDCIFLEWENIGGTRDGMGKEYGYWAHYCRAKDSYEDDILCKDCEFYDNGERRLPHLLGRATK